MQAAAIVISTGKMPSGRKNYSTLCQACAASRVFPSRTYCTCLVLCSTACTLSSDRQCGCLGGEYWILGICTDDDASVPQAKISTLTVDDVLESDPELREKLQAEIAAGKWIS